MTHRIFCAVDEEKGHHLHIITAVWEISSLGGVVCGERRRWKGKRAIAVLWKIYRIMTHMFQFYTIHWTGTIFWGLEMTGHDRPSPESRDHGCIHMLRDCTYTHQLWRCFSFFFFSFCFPPFKLTTRIHKNVHHNEPVPFKNATTMTSMAHKLINKSSSIRSLPQNQTKSPWEQATVGYGWRLRVIYWIFPTFFIDREGDDKEHQLISKK